MSIETSGEPGRATHPPELMTDVVRVRYSGTTAKKAGKGDDGSQIHS